MSFSFFSPALKGNVFDVFDSSFKNFGELSEFVSSSLPSTDIRETDNAYLLDIDLPGFKEDEVELSLNDKILTISSSQEKQNEKTENKGNYIIRERSSKKFMRRFTLPDDIDGENIRADFENGVLQIVIARKEETRPKQIPINKSR